MEELLDLVVELVGLLLAHVLQPGAEVRQRLARGDGVQRRVVETVELELEEQQVGRGRRQALLRVAVEFRALGVGRVARIDEPGIGDDAAEPILQRLVAANRRVERLPGLLALPEGFELAAIGVRERLALGLASREVGREFR